MSRPQTNGARAFSISGNCKIELEHWPAAAMNLSGAFPPSVSDLDICFTNRDLGLA